MKGNLEGKHKAFRLKDWDDLKLANHNEQKWGVRGQMEIQGKIRFLSGNVDSKLAFNKVGKDLVGKLNPTLQ